MSEPSPPFRLWFCSRDKRIRFNGFVHPHDFFSGEASLEELRVIVPLQSMLPKGTYSLLTQRLSKLPNAEQGCSWVFHPDFPKGNRIEIKAHCEIDTPEFDLVYRATEPLRQIIDVQRLTLAVNLNHVV